MKKSLLFILIVGIIFSGFIGCRHTQTAGNEPESSETVTNEQETEDIPTIFDKILSGEPINEIQSLYDFTEVFRVQDYYAIGANTHGENKVMVLYSGKEGAVAIVYDISNGKEKSRIEMDIELSLNARPVGVNEEFSYICEENGVFIYLDWENEEYEIIELDDTPMSYLMLGDGESIYYTVEDDCNIYTYIYGSERCYSVYDGSDIVNNLELKYLIAAGTSIVLYVESEGYSGYAQLSIEMQELTVFDSLSGELIYNDNEYIYTAPDKANSIFIYNPMTPRVSKEFKIENPKEIETLIFYKDEGLFLTRVKEPAETIRFYDLEEGILKNQLIVSEEYEVLDVEYFGDSLCVLVECRDENGEYRPLIWNTDIIEEILE